MLENTNVKRLFHASALEFLSHLLCPQLFNLLIYALWMHCQRSIFYPPANWKLSSAVRTL